MPDCAEVKVTDSDPPQALNDLAVSDVPPVIVPVPEAVFPVPVPTPTTVLPLRSGNLKSVLSVPP